MRNIFHRAQEKFYLGMFKRTFIRDYNAFCDKKIGHALLYYKTDPFVIKRLASAYTHTNNWEILEIARVFNQLGFWVDIVDRDIDIKKLKLEDKYTFFVGLGAGNSGRHFAELASRLPSAIKILYAAGPEPTLSNQLIINRYKYFEERHNGKKMKLLRMIDVDIERFMNVTDSIFCIGGEFTTKSYRKFNKDIYGIVPSTSPALTADWEQLTKRDKKKFLYFGGNGNIVKGLDILLDVFSKLPDLELYVCAPSWERDFNEHYAPLLKSSSNIHFAGFVSILGKTFADFTSQCGFTIFPSCSEGYATSVVTCMRRGLIPAITLETDVPMGDYGFILDDISIPALTKKVRALSEMSDQEFKERSIKTYAASAKFTQHGFSTSFQNALLGLMAKYKLGGPKIQASPSAQEPVPAEKARY